jgi:hypothetical protein
MFARVVLNFFFHVFQELIASNQKKTHWSTKIFVFIKIMCFKSDLIFSLARQVSKITLNESCRSTENAQIDKLHNQLSQKPKDTWFLGFESLFKN